MTTWLIDTALFAVLGTPKAEPLRRWCEDADASLYLSAASLTEIAAAIARARTHPRSAALRKWLDGISDLFADRIHPIDSSIAIRAGALAPSLVNALPRHRRHDALLVATAQIHGHALLTRRDGVFGPRTNVPVTII